MLLPRLQVEGRRCISIGSWTGLSTTVLRAAFALLSFLALVSSLYCPLLTKPLHCPCWWGPQWKRQYPQPNGLPASVLKATTQDTTSGFGVMWKRGEQPFPGPTACAHNILTSFFQTTLSVMVLNPLPIKTQNQSKMVNRCHPFPQQEHWFIYIPSWITSS